MLGKNFLPMNGNALIIFCFLREGSVLALGVPFGTNLALFGENGRCTRQSLFTRELSYI